MSSPSSSSSSLNMSSSSSSSSSTNSQMTRTQRKNKKNRSKKKQNQPEEDVVFADIEEEHQNEDELKDELEEELEELEDEEISDDDSLDMDELDSLSKDEQIRLLKRRVRKLEEANTKLSFVLLTLVPRLQSSNLLHQKEISELEKKYSTEVEELKQKNAKLEKHLKNLRNLYKAEIEKNKKLEEKFDRLQTEFDQFKSEQKRRDEESAKKDLLLIRRQILLSLRRKLALALGQSADDANYAYLKKLKKILKQAAPTPEEDQKLANEFASQNLVFSADGLENLELWFGALPGDPNAVAHPETITKASAIEAVRNSPDLSESQKTKLLSVLKVLETLQQTYCRDEPLFASQVQ